MLIYIKLVESLDKFILVNTRLRCILKIEYEVYKIDVE